MATAAPHSGGRLLGVGVGPGDPELVTRQALRVLAESDRVVAPSSAVDAVGRAEAIVRQASPDVRMERLVFDMSGDGAHEGRGRAAREASHEAAARALLPWLDGGEQVAFVTLGDPNIYSTFSSLTAAVRCLRPAVDIGTVPGIMAFQALAAEAGVVLLDGTESLSLVTALDGPEAVDAALEDPARAVVVYKGGRHVPEIAALLSRAGRLDGAVMGELLGLPGERTGPLARLATGPASYLATVIIPPGDRRP
ncbi:MAG TPA: precorrin-2 C(20)-methyltransferase [Acidimicrobiales bacterium]|nr:precorrin-2 C(20)-methyltransferase [Acidimicrobiales bacterium]